MKVVSEVGLDDNLIILLQRQEFSLAMAILGKQITAHMSSLG